MIEDPKTFHVVVVYEMGGTTCTDRFIAVGAEEGAVAATWVNGVLVLMLRNGRDMRGRVVSAKMYGHAFYLTKYLVDSVEAVEVNSGEDSKAA